MNLGKETENIEFKKSTGELHQAIQSIAAILNKHGYGELYFGVLDNGEAVGQEVSDSTIRAVSEAISRDIEPRITPDIEWIEYEGRQVIKVAFSGNNRPYSAFGRFLIRVGTQNRSLTSIELRRLIIDEDYAQSWENGFSDASIDDISESTLREYFDEAVSSGRLAMERFDKRALLASLDLIQGDRVRNAAIALFGSKARIGLKVASFATDDKITFTDLNDMKGNIFDLYHRALFYISDHMDWRAVITDRRREYPEVPMEAIREIVINAFAHAKYRPTPEIEINFHPNKIVIFNPGSFPSDMTPNDFISGYLPSIKRNPLIIDVLYRCRGVEKAGTGFKRMAEICAKDGVSWDYQNTAYGFFFVFYRHHKAPRGKKEKIAKDGTACSLTPNQRIIYRMIAKDPKVSREEMAKRIKKSTRTVQRATDELSDRGLISRVGGNQYGYWKVIGEIK